MILHHMLAMLVLLIERSLPLEACPGDCASVNQARESMEIWFAVYVLAPDLISANSRLQTEIENELNTTTCDTRATPKRGHGNTIRGTRQTGMESTRN